MSSSLRGEPAVVSLCAGDAPHRMGVSEREGTGDGWRSLLRNLRMVIVGESATGLNRSLYSLWVTEGGTSEWTKTFWFHYFSHANQLESSHCFHLMCCLRTFPSILSASCLSQWCAKTCLFQFGTPGSDMSSVLVRWMQSTLFAGGCTNLWVNG